MPLDERSSIRIGVLSKAETEMIKIVILDLIDSRPGVLTSKIVSEHVFKVTGLQLSSFQTIRILKKKLCLSFRRLNGVNTSMNSERCMV
jgi:hypothetical protein